MTPSRAKTPLHETLKPGDLMMVVGLLAVFPTDLALLTQQYCHAQCLPFLIFHFFFLILFGGNEKSYSFAQKTHADVHMSALRSAGFGSSLSLFSIQYALYMLLVRQYF